MPECWRGVEDVRPRKRFFRACKQHGLELLSETSRASEDILYCPIGCIVTVKNDGRSDLDTETMPFEVVESENV